MKTRRRILVILALALMLVFAIWNGLAVRGSSTEFLTGLAFWGSVILFFASLIGWRPSEEKRHRNY